MKKREGLHDRQGRLSLARVFSHTLRSPTTWTVLGLAALLLVVSWWANFLASHVDRKLIDEEIVVAVLDHISMHRTLDTNWSNVEAVSRFYPANQYNFSSAILFYGLFSGVLFNPDQVVDITFRLVPILFATTSLVVFFLTFRTLAGNATALASVVLTALSYQFITEAISIRPEAFIYFGYALALGLAVWSRPPAFVSAFLIGICSGLLMASKFSMLFVWAQAFALLLLVRLDMRPTLASVRAALRPAAVLFAASLPGCILGLMIGAPYAVLDPLGTLDGVHALLQQYSGAHYPFGRPDSGLVGRLAHALNQTQSHIGAITLCLSAAALAVAIRRRAWPTAFLAVSSVLFIGYFAVKPVFFARNFSLLIPVLAFLAMTTVAHVAHRIDQGWRRGAFFTAVVVVLCVQPAWSSIAVGRAITSFEERRERHYTLLDFYEAHTGLSAETINGWDAYKDLDAFHAGLESRDRALVYIGSLNDPFSAAVLKSLAERPTISVAPLAGSALGRFPSSMVHYNFDVNDRYVLYDRRGTGRLPEVVFEDEWCPDPLPSTLDGDFQRDGFHVSSTPGFDAFGSWLGGDGASATALMRLSQVPEGAILPVFTGPGRDGLTVSISGREAEAVSTSGQWLGIPLPASASGLEIMIRDAGTGWGDWGAFAPPRLICR